MNSLKEVMQIFDKDHDCCNGNHEVKKIIVGIHGIKTKRDSWVDSFIAFSKTFFKDEHVLYVDYEYGYLSAILCTLPFVKGYLVRAFKRKLRKLQKANPDADLNIVGHSYGTEMTHIAVKTSGEDGGVLIKTDNIILVGSILNVQTDLSQLFAKGQFNTFHVYSSLEDEVCRFNPFGHSGYMRLYDDFAINHRHKKLEHGGYFTADFFRQWAEIFDLKEREL